jgi:flagellar basal body-associated protein FliL
MSESEQTSGPAKNKSLWISAIAVVVVGGCLLVCAGIMAVGLVVPAVMRQQQQTLRAEQEARNAEQLAKAAAETMARPQAPANAGADRLPQKEENADPTRQDAPTDDDAQVGEAETQAREP